MAAYYSPNQPLYGPYEAQSAESANDLELGNIEASPTAELTGIGDPNLENISQSESETPRKCSVRGCVAVMPQGSTNKMCDACRGRHRVYAMTKRAKRKMEKAAINQQSAALLSTEQPPGTIWMPENPELEDEPIHDSISGVQGQGDLSDQTQTPDPEAPILHSLASIPQPIPWDHTVLDPRLISTQSSELAGALTLPSQATPNTSPTSAGYTSGYTSGNPLSSSSRTISGTDPNDVDAPYIPPENVDGAPSSSSRPLRFCSVKGCKTMISADYFFKMCEPCRDRYRGYGITKRAKWRAERVAANAELEVLRIEEDKRRAEEGLPPLAESPEDWIAWQNDLVDGPLLTQTEDKDGPFPARMCTVSHCHAILSGHYKYRRCEQHRLQNRHHSKLKRVREKEVKAQAAKTAEESADEFRLWAPRGESSKKKDEEVGPLFTHIPMDIDRDRRTESPGVHATEILIGTANLPPPVQGSRRSNHVCSIKGCYNLLSPQIPWKMCDVCREHDRENRKNKKLRDLGELPPIRFQITTVGQKKDTSTSIDVCPQEPSHIHETASSSTSPNTSTSDLSAQPAEPVISQSFSPNDADEDLMDPVHPEASADEVLTGSDALRANDIPDAPILASIITPENAPGQTNISTVAEIGEPMISATPAASEEPQPSKKGKYKVKDLQGNAPVKKRLKAKDGAVATTSVDATLNQAPPPPFPYGSPYAAHMQPQYQLPYYIPHYYSIPPPVSAASTSQTTALQTPPVQHTYPYPHAYGHYPPYSSRPYQLQQPYGPYAYLPPQYNASQPHLQPYGSSAFPGQSPYSYVPPPNSQTQKSQSSKPVQRRKRKRLAQDQELPGAQGSTSYTSVFLVSPPSPVPTPDLNPVPPSQNSHPQDEQEVVEMVTPEQACPTVTQVMRRCANQSCHRNLAEGCNGTLCERCRTRMKKRQDKAKKKYKLEPRQLLVRPGTVGQKAASDNSRP